MKLELGKTYITRDGKARHKIIEKDGVIYRSNAIPGLRAFYAHGGKFPDATPHPSDLVAEWCPVKLELGRRYVLRNGMTTGPMMPNLWPGICQATVAETVFLWNINDGTSGDRDSRRPCIPNEPHMDVVALYDAESTEPKDTAARCEASSSKPSNPKDVVGVRKFRQFTCIPFTVLAELGVALLEGAAKYGAHNYRVAGVRASIYIDAAMGHILQWWEGEDIDADSGLSHITKAIASLTVLRDAMINDMLTDDRPVKPNLDKLRSDLQASVDALFDKYPNMEPRNTECKE